MTMQTVYYLDRANRNIITCPRICAHDVLSDYARRIPNANIVYLGDRVPVLGFDY